MLTATKDRSPGHFRFGPVISTPHWPERANVKVDQAAKFTPPAGPGPKAHEGLGRSRR